MTPLVTGRKSESTPLIVTAWVRLLRKCSNHFNKSSRIPYAYSLCSSKTVNDAGESVTVVEVNYVSGFTIVLAGHPFSMALNKLSDCRAATLKAVLRMCDEVIILQKYLNLIDDYTFHNFRDAGYERNWPIIGRRYSRSFFMQGNNLCHFP